MPSIRLISIRIGLAVALAAAAALAGAAAEHHAVSSDRGAVITASQASARIYDCCE